MAKSRTAAPAFTTILLVRHGNTPTTGKVLPGRAKGFHSLTQDEIRQRLLLSELRLSLEWTQFTAHLLNGPEKLQHRLPLNEVSRQRLTEAYSSANSEIGPAPNCRNSQSCPSGRQCSAPSTFRFPNGESFTEMQVRMVSTLDRLRSAHPGGTVVCVSHADPIKAAVAHAVGTHLDLFQRIVISTCSISALAWSPHGPAVLAVNTTAGPIGDLALS